MLLFASTIAYYDYEYTGLLNRGTITLLWEYLANVE